MDLENVISRVAKAMVAGRPSEEEALAILQERRSEIIRTIQDEGVEVFSKLNTSELKAQFDRESGQIEVSEVWPKDSGLYSFGSWFGRFPKEIEKEIGFNPQWYSGSVKKWWEEVTKLMTAWGNRKFLNVKLHAGLLIDGIKVPAIVEIRSKQPYGLGFFVVSQKETLSRLKSRGGEVDPNDVKHLVDQLDEKFEEIFSRHIFTVQGRIDLEVYHEPYSSGGEYEPPSGGESSVDILTDKVWFVTPAAYFDVDVNVLREAFKKWSPGKKRFTFEVKTKLGWTMFEGEFIRSFKIVGRNVFYGLTNLGFEDENDMEDMAEDFVKEEMNDAIVERGLSRNEY
jgi:hypothetical protein